LGVPTAVWQPLQVVVNVPGSEPPQVPPGGIIAPPVVVDPPVVLEPPVVVSVVLDPLVVLEPTVVLDPPVVPEPTVELEPVPELPGSVPNERPIVPSSTVQPGSAIAPRKSKLQVTTAVWRRVAIISRLLSFPGPLSPPECPLFAAKIIRPAAPE